MTMFNREELIHCKLAISLGPYNGLAHKHHIPKGEAKKPYYRC